MAEGTNELTWDEIVQLLSQSPQYADPSTAGLGGKTVQQNLSILQDFQDMTGVPFIQLFGTDPQGFQPKAPETGMIYGSNPMFAQAFSNMAAGSDPIQVLEDIKANPGKYNVDKSVVKDETWQAQTFDILERFARENVETAQFNQENAGTYKIGNKEYRGDPNIWSRQSQYDLLGAPSEDELIRSYADSLVSSTKSRAKKPMDYEAWLEANRDEQFPKITGPHNPKSDTIPQGVLKSSVANSKTSWAVPGYENQDYRKYHAGETNKMVDYQKRVGLSDPDSDAYKAYEKAYAEGVARAKNTRVASDAEKALVSKILLMRGLIGA